MKCLRFNSCSHLVCWTACETRDSFQYVWFNVCLVLSFMAEVSDLLNVYFTAVVLIIIFTLWAELLTVAGLINTFSNEGAASAARLGIAEQLALRPCSTLMHPRDPPILRTSVSGATLLSWPDACSASKRKNTDPKEWVFSRNMQPLLYTNLKNPLRAVPGPCPGSPRTGQLTGIWLGGPEMVSGTDCCLSPAV